MLGDDGRGRFFTTEYTETVEPILKNTEKISVCSRVAAESRFSVYLSGKFSRRIFGEGGCNVGGNMI